MAAGGAAPAQQKSGGSTGGAAGGGGPETLKRLLSDLCARAPSKDAAALLLRKHVEEEVRDLGGEALTRFMDYLYHRISAMIESSDASENLGALRAIKELIDVNLGESTSKVSKLASYLRHVFEEKQDPEVLITASKVLGHLARSGGAMTPDEVERQVKHALEWLQGERVESRRLAAVLILKEMAENAPTVFNVHVPDFVDAVWVALRDPKLAVRERAVEALRACLGVIEKRETRWRVQWYYRMFEATQDGLGKNASVESIHGSLLAVGELLRNTGEFMMSRYKEVADIVFKYREHRDRLVRRSITALLPRIAHFLRDRFVTSYLKICMDHLLAVMRNPAERASGFIALAEMAGAVAGELEPYLPVITSLLRDAIAPRRGRPSMEALSCIGSLAKAMGSAMEEHVRGLLDAMFLPGLTHTLVEALENIVSSLPSLLPTIQEQLLDSISYVLAKSSYRLPRAAAVPVRPPAGGLYSPQMPEVSGSALIQLALRTLASFDLEGHELLEFTREAVVSYLEDEDAVTRRDAAVCCCWLVEHSFSSSNHFNSNQSTRSSVGSRRRRQQIEEILEKLLITAVADADANVRKAVMISLHANESFDMFLAQADSLRAIFFALNDEAFEVRELAISIAGRLSELNPAYVLPALRCHLVQLLTELEHSADSKNREESARLLGCLIRACERLLMPYIAPVHKALVLKLCEGSGGGTNNSVITGVLSTIGDLARVGGFAMRPYLGELMPLIVEALLDGASASRRESAVSTLGQVIQSTGYVVTPYTEYPQLLGLLLRLLNGELTWSTRREALKVLGIMGALDPHIHKRNQQSLQGGHTESNRTAAGDAVGQQIQSLEDNVVELWPSGGLFTTSEDYYSTVAINALMRMLRDPLSSYHPKVVGSLMYIFKTMGLGCVPYLAKVMPELFHTIRICEEGLREFIFRQLAVLVSIVKQHIRKCLPDMLQLILEFWTSLILPVTTRSSGSPILDLVEQLCIALNDEFQAYLPEILPRCIQVLCDAERSGDYKYVPPILHTLEVFGASLDEHMHLLLPALVRFFRPDVSDAPLDIRRATVKTLTRLLPLLQVSGHVAALMHPLKQILDGTSDELRKDGIDAICALAIALGADFSIFIPSVRKLLQRHRMQHTQFDAIEGRLRRREPVLLDVQAISITSSHAGAAGLVVLTANSSFSNLDGDGDRYEDGLDSCSQAKNFKVNDGRLRAAWEASQRSTKEDWAEWMRHFSVELLKESPSPALRTCARLAQLQPFVGRELFAAGFVSCWAQLNEAYQQQLVRSLEMAFSSPNIPPEILATLLNLAEFMEHDEKPLPIDIRLLGALAEKCRAFAKALHYKEMEFEGAQTKKMEANPVAVVEALIHINNQLHQHEAAVGILTYAQQHLGVDLKESWYEKLQRWEEALAAYTLKAYQTTSPHVAMEATLGRMRCLAALARWEELNALCREHWTPAEPGARLDMAPMAASAAWNMGEWDQMAEYVSKLDDDGDETMFRSLGNVVGSADGISNGAFYRAVLCVRRGKNTEAREYIERARKCLATEIAALVLESYDRAYSHMVRVQQLAELEEVIDYSILQGSSGNEARTGFIRKMWQERIRGTKRNVEVWEALLAVRALVLPPTDDIQTWLKFASLCRKSGRVAQSRANIVRLLQYDPEVFSVPEKNTDLGSLQVMFAYLKHEWSLGEDSKQREAFKQLQTLAVKVEELSQSSDQLTIFPGAPSSTSNPGTGVSLLGRIYLKLGDWCWSINPSLDESSVQEILNLLQNATVCAPAWPKAWHKWALFNTAVMSHYSSRGSTLLVRPHVEAAVIGYFHSIKYASTSKGGDNNLQDILRLLTLWFNHGAIPEVKTALQDGFGMVSIDTWLVVLPQIIARIHSNIPSVRELVQSLLVRIGRGHPQALMYPLLVACKSISSLRRTAAQQVVDQVRRHSGVLVEQAQLVSKELIRVAILWHEMWHEAIEEASRLYFGEHNVEGMLNVLAPLHSMLQTEGPTTLNDIHFVQNYGHELQEAYDCCLKYRLTGKEAELTQAWDLYYHVFRRITKQLPLLTTLELQNVSPALLEARNLELAVPGTYRAGAPLVTIAGFAPQLIVITSKQRPRKCTIHGSDGEDYAFLLKGHEDLRQDERVMQLFGLVNTLLANAPATAEKDLSIQRYAVIPLSPNSGLIGWVPNCDTLHHLIREYRDARKVPLNMEHRLMQAFAPDYEHLALMAKVEVFEHALQNTEGIDLAKVLWLKSRTSEVWLDRRTNYTRSLAVMSMVGYLLGLGDRHPSNLMLHRHSGKILHIDFGDCFEASMNREKFPEKVPFRLTRMLVKAMEVSGIEGNFRSTCENVMQVLRTNKDSVMAMMEAFVHDPLINWRLFNINDVPHMTSLASVRAPGPASEDPGGSSELPSPPQRGVRERNLLQAVGQLGDANEVLNERAVAVMARMRNKLTGRDFIPSTISLNGASNGVGISLADPCGLGVGDMRDMEPGLTVKVQVQKLITQATSHENLCQSYVGWCPFW